MAFLVLKGLVYGIGEFLESNKFSFQGVKVSNFGSPGLVFWVQVLGFMFNGSDKI
jgi:hypothetical protein